MKLLHIIDMGAPTQADDLINEKYQNKYYKKLKEEYGLDVDYVIDDCLKIGDSDYSAGCLKVEKEGPEWCVHNAETLEAVKDAKIICVSFCGVNKQLIDAAENCKMVVILRSGKENVNIDYCTEKGIKVVNAPGRVSDPVADMTVAMMLAVIREIQRLDLHRLEWDYARKIRVQPKDKPLISDMTIGFVGFGIIAAKVATRLAGFKPERMIAYDPFVKPEVAKQYNVELVSLEELMKTSDLVSVHARLLPETEKLVSKEMIDLMKPTAYFVNTARSGLVDNDALYDALANNRIRAAALDVFDTEPLPQDDRFLQLGNVTATPHMSGGAGDSIAITLGIVFEDIFGFLSEGKVVHKCN
ncbi:MAG: NAD(P)-dependent oxidoreductase [Erysipelotrichaceae bacterium]